MEEQGEGGVGARAIAGIVDGDKEAVGAGVAELVDDIGEVLLVEESGGLRVTEDGFELRGMEAHVERHDDGAGKRDGVVALEEGIAIEAENADAISGGNAVGDEAGSDAAAAVGEFGIGVSVFAGDYGGLIGIEIERAEEAAKGG